MAIQPIETIAARSLPDHDAPHVPPAAGALQALQRTECLALAAGMPYGRIVYTERALPVIVPVNFAIDVDSIVIRTARRSRLAAAVGQVVAFEVDSIDVSTGAGWSVVFTGRLGLVVDPVEQAHCDSLDLTPWAGIAVDRYLRLRAEIVTGRRLVGALAEDRPAD